VRKPALAVFALAATVLALSAAAGTGAGAAEAQDGTTIGIDADPDGNEAASLDAINDCVSVSDGDSFEVDVYITDVSELIAWEAYVSYDPDVLRVVDRDVGWFLEESGASAFDGSHPVPDDDGLYLFSAAVPSSTGDSQSGSGVLGRLTFEAVGPGVTTVTANPVDRDDDGEPDIGPALRDNEQQLIEEQDDGDAFFDGAIVDAEVAVDRECADGSASPGSTDNDDDGDWWIIALIAALVAAVVALAALVWLRLRGAARRGGGTGL